MIYSKCAVCNAPVYRYDPDGPKAGQMGNAGQDCWSVGALHPKDHFPTWQAPKTLADAQFVSETLFTDTLVYEVVGRTDKTLRLRRTKDGDGKRAENRDGNPYPCVYTEQVPDVDAPVFTVRLRKDGTYRTGRGMNPLRPITGTPERFTDYRY